MKSLKEISYSKCRHKTQ